MTTVLKNGDQIPLCSISKENIGEHVYIGNSEKYGQGGHNLPLKNEKGGRLEFQTPPMNVTFDHKVTEGYGGVGSPECKLSLQGGSGAQEGVMEAMKAIDDFAINHICDNKSSYFKKHVSDAYVRDSFYSSVKQDSEQKYPPYIQAKVDWKYGTDANGVLDENISAAKSRLFCIDINNNAVLQPDCLTRGTQVVAIFSPVNIWLISGRCGIIWRCSRVAVLVRASSSDWQYRFNLPDLNKHAETNINNNEEGVSSNNFVSPDSIEGISVSGN